MRRYPWEGHTYPKEEFCIPIYLGGGPVCSVWWMVYGVTVNGEPVCHALLHPKCGVAGTCQGSCLKGGH